MKNHLFIKSLLLMALAVFFVVACVPETSARPDFRAALNAHLAAIMSKDITAYKNTITSDDDLYLIFPGGEAMATTSEVVEFHTDWFTDTNWVMEPEIVKSTEGVELATALLKYAYRDTPEGEPRSSWLLLVFELEDGEWRLVHDQNTRISQLTETESE